MPASAANEGNAAVSDRLWARAAAVYMRADAERPLSPAELERWGLAAFLTGRDADSDSARERAHHGYLAAGDVEGAARVGFWLALTLTLRGEQARAGGWFARAQTLLDEHGLSDSVWQLFLRLSRGMQVLFAGDAELAVAEFERILADAARYDHPDLYVLVRNGHGQALVATGRIDAGLRRLDEVMVAVTSNDAVSPQVVGLMYCAVVETCRRCFDLRRAREWTDALSRWCARQPDLVPYRGQCLVHRAEVLQLHGFWTDAREEVERVFGQLGEEPTDVAAGMAHYQRGELHRLRGETDAAEECYRRAARCGRDPQPGMALLRLAQGRVDAARAAIRRILDEDTWPHERLRLLPACVEVALATGDLDAAAAAAAEMRAAVGHRDVPMLAAAADYADGRVTLARGDQTGALRALRAALSQWQRLGAPYEAALTRVHIATACLALGDVDSAELELDAARWTFEQLGAAPDLARVDAGRRRPAAASPVADLTSREAQVLRMLATGATNRAIATQLFVSEKTVARHVANIFLKLGLTSRAAATAFAYQHHVV